MRPTLSQVYNDPKAIIAALEAKEFPNAQARVMSMYRTLIEYWSMHRYYDRLDNDRTHVLQSDERRMRWPTAKPDPVQKMRDRKQAGEYNKTLIVARGYLKRKAKAMEAKIDQWPDLDLDPAKLRKKPDNTMSNKVLKKRMRKNKPRTHVLG